MMQRPVMDWVGGMNAIADRLGSVGEAGDELVKRIADGIKLRKMMKEFGEFKTNYAQEVVANLGDDMTPEQKLSTSKKIMAVENKEEFLAKMTAFEQQAMMHKENPNTAKPVFGMSFDYWKQLNSQTQEKRAGELTSQLTNPTETRLSGDKMVPLETGTQLGQTPPQMKLFGSESVETEPAKAETPLQLQSQLMEHGMPADLAKGQAATMRQDQELAAKKQKEAGISGRAQATQQIAKDRIDLARETMRSGNYLKKLAITSSNAKSVSETAGKDAENLEFALGAYVDPSDPNVGMIPELQMQIDQTKNSNAPNKGVMLAKLENDLKTLESEQKRTLDTYKKALERKRLADEELLNNSGVTQPTQPKQPKQPPKQPAQGKPLTAQVMAQAKQMFGADKEAAKQWLIQQGYSVQ